MSLRHEHWQASVDGHGATTGVEPAEQILLGPAGPRQLGSAIAEHVAPMVPGVCTTSRLTAVTALGGPATSLAGVFARIHRGWLPSTAPRWQRRPRKPSKRWKAWPAVNWYGRRLTAQEPGLLQQHRTTCCLIRLGREQPACDTCPRLAREERVRLQRERHRRSEAAPISRESSC